MVNKPLRRHPRSVQTIFTVVSHLQGDQIVLFLAAIIFTKVA